MLLAIVTCSIKKDISIGWELKNEDRKGKIALQGMLDRALESVSNVFTVRMREEEGLVSVEIESTGVRSISVTSCFYRVEEGKVVTENDMDDLVVEGTNIVVVEVRNKLCLDWRVVCCDKVTMFGVVLEDLETKEVFVSGKALIIGVKF